MQKHSVHILMAVLTAAAAVACSDPINNNHPTSLRDATGEQRGQDARLTMKGCVAEASKGHEFILRDATLLPAAEQHAGQDVGEHGASIPPGSWVRLAGGTQDLTPFLGQRVEVSGDVVDSGANTIGTSGKEEDVHQKFARSSKDADSNPDRANPPTTVAPAMADANGNAPRIAIETISKTDGSCSEK